MQLDAKKLKVPGSWNGWNVQWFWLERVAEYDHWCDQQDDLEFQRLRRERRKKQTEYEEKFVYPAILTLTNKLIEMMASDLSKTTRFDNKGRVSKSVDRLRNLEVLSRLCERREVQYFGPDNPRLDGSPGGDGKEEVAVAGKFEWVRDPDVEALLAAAELKTASEPQDPDE
jgi:hypothetical protein